MDSFESTVQYFSIFNRLYAICFVPMWYLKLPLLFSSYSTPQQQIRDGMLESMNFFHDLAFCAWNPILLRLETFTRVWSVSIHSSLSSSELSSSGVSSKELSYKRQHHTFLGLIRRLEIVFIFPRLVSQILFQIHCTVRFIISVWNLPQK